MTSVRHIDGKTICMRRLDLRVMMAELFVNRYETLCYGVSLWIKKNAIQIKLQYYISKQDS